MYLIVTVGFLTHELNKEKIIIKKTFYYYNSTVSIFNTL